jgi:hypothetical protein
MASILRNTIYDGVDFDADYIPYIYNGTAWVEAHTQVYTGSAWVQIPNWKAAAKRPTVAMTANTTGSFVASASTENSTSYAAWCAFNNDYSDAYGWASTNADATPWIMLQMDIPLKNISVVIKNRTRASLVNGILTATIYGGDSAAGCTNVICNITTARSAASAAVTTHACTNAQVAYRWVKIKPLTWTHDATNQYVAVGEIEITGKYAA